MRIVIFLLLLVIIGGIIGFVVFSEPEATKQTLIDAESALKQGNHEEAMRLTERYLDKYPDSSEGKLVAGNIYLELDEPNLAYERYKSALTDDNPLLVETRQLCARVARSLALASEAEDHLREILDTDEMNADAHKALFNILRIEGRNTELARHFMANIRRRKFDLQEVLVMANPDRVHFAKNDQEFIDACIEAVPDDPLPLVGRAWTLVAESRHSDALPVLIDACKARPELLSVQGLLGQALLGIGTKEQLTEWFAQLPDNKDENSVIWLVRGELAARAGKPQQAARCFWEGLRANPIDRQCAYQLGQMLSREDGFEEEARKCKDYATGLADLSTLAFEAGPNAPEKMKQVVDGMVKYGRIWEAVGWCYGATQIPSENGWANVEVRKLLTELEAVPPFVLAEKSVANEIDLSDWAVPENELLASAGQAADIAIDENTVAASFIDEAEAKGIRFRFNTSVSTRPKMFEFSGGGSGAIDFDRDGWPDIYLTQGAKWPVDLESSSFTDQLFRNVGGESFVDVTVSAIEADRDYSQGAAIGDVNNDGFPDIFVGNIGANTLFENNGDGTFSQVPLSDELAGTAWTIGCAIADLNGDAVPDIYELNYLGGDDIVTRSCNLQNAPSQCSPGYFPAEPDRLLVGTGDGAVRDVTEQAGIAPDGKGMGLVAFRYPGERQLSMFVANDMCPNQLYRPVDGGFEERGMLAGIGLSNNGMQSSCMGVAAADINGDGLMDFHVTNYRNEANNLFLQQEQDFFEDAIEGTGLRNASYRVMGWGTQFLDANLDGRLDLLVSNGHLEIKPEGTESEMKPHLLMNIGGGRFGQSDNDSMTTYFKKAYFGRSVSKLDWNRDGLPDAVITHRGTPVALLTNTTKEPGESVRVSFVGESIARDAVGTIATLTTNKRKMVRQITAGDGFQASNQKYVLFGLTEGEEVESLLVSWPSGTETTLSEVPVNVDLVLSETALKAVSIPK